MAYGGSNNPVLEAIQGYKMVDDIFRQKRSDKQADEDRAIQLQRQAVQDQQQAKQFEWKEEEWKRLDKTRRIQALQEKLKSGLPTDPAEVTELIGDIDFFQEQVKELHTAVPEMLKTGSPEAGGKVVNAIANIDSDRFTKFGQRYGRPVSVFADPKNPGSFMIEGEFAEWMRDKEGQIVMDAKGRPVIDESTRRIAPLTENATSDPGDPVKTYTIKDTMGRIIAKSKALDALRAKLIELGDPGAIKESGAISDAKAAAAAMRKMAEDPGNQDIKDKLINYADLAESGDLPLDQIDKIMKLLKPERDYMAEAQIKHNYRMEEITRQGQNALERALIRSSRGGRGGGNGSDDEDSAGGGQYDEFVTKLHRDAPPILERVPKGSRAWHRYTTGDLAATGRVKLIGKGKNRLSPEDATKQLEALDNVTETVSEQRGGKTVSVKRTALNPEAVKYKKWREGEGRKAATPKGATPNVQSAKPAAKKTDASRWKFVGYSKNGKKVWKDPSIKDESKAYFEEE